jgi:hypothetical protein
MAIGNRKTDRQARRVRIRFGIDETSSYLGYTSNVSRSGIRLEVRRRFPERTRLWLEIGDSGVRIWGTVRWTRQVPVQFLNAGQLNSMGIAFDLPSEVARQASSNPTVIPQGLADEPPLVGPPA